MCNDKHRSGAQNKLHEQSACESSSTYNSSTSDIFQCDGADSISSTSSIHSEDTEYNTEDEALTEREPAVLVPAPQQPGPGQPLVLEVAETSMMVPPASLHLIMLTNERSVYNKINNFTEWLLQIFPDCVIVSKTFEHKTMRTRRPGAAPGQDPFEVLSYRRPGGWTRGCCAIVYNTSKFLVEEITVVREEKQVTKSKTNLCLFCIYSPKIPKEN